MSTPKVKVKVKVKGSKQKIKRSKTNTNSQNTISGISQYNILIPIFSAIIGMIVFICIPYTANHFSKPFTAAALNIIPNGIILGYFVLDTEFDTYFKSLVFVPAFNVAVNIITYLLFSYKIVSAFWALTLNISAWILLVIISLFYN
jgi:hypothetical protein